MRQSQETHDQCNHQFSKCISAQNIKSILEEFNKIISDKNSKSEHETSSNITELVNKKFLNGYYSNVKLTNDFFHVKYNHNTNENPNQFNLFYQYLCDDNNTLLCDSKYCNGYKRYYRNREKLMNESEYKHTDTCDNSSYSYNMLCRMHSFFIHSYELYKLTKSELAHIEQQLSNNKNINDEEINHQKLVLISKVLNDKKQNASQLSATNYSKYITLDDESLNYRQMSQTLAETGLVVDEHQLQITFDKYGVGKQQIINDLCDSITNENDENTLLTQILMEQLNFNETECRKFYDTILHGCFKKEELNQRNFSKILIYTAFDLYPTINYSAKEIEEIVRNENLNGNIFTKGTKEFKNSANFGKLFKGNNNWNKKQWGKIYREINKWHSKTYKKIETDEYKKIETNKSVEPQDVIKAHAEKDTINYIDQEFMIDEDILNL
eukprot:22344_1